MRYDEIGNRVFLPRIRRVRKAVVIISFALGLSIALLLLFEESSVIKLLVLATSAAWFLAVALLAFMVCPRCGFRFFNIHFGVNNLTAFFASKCAHCSLSLFQDLRGDAA